MAMIDLTKCSRCEKPPEKWVHLYFVDGTDLPLCGEHGAQFAMMHPFGPQVSSTTYADRPRTQRRKAVRHGR